MNYMINSTHSVQSAPSSNPSSKKKSNTKLNATFLTEEKEIKSIETIIAQNFSELNQYIESLDPRIKTIVQKNEAELLIAYRNHFSRIKEEVLRFKEQTLAQVKNQANVLTKMDKMEKQLIVFRDQSLRLYSHIMEKDKKIEELQKKIYELDSQKEFLKGKLKELMKHQKDAQIKDEEYADKKEREVENYIKTSDFKKTFQSLGIHTYKKSIRRDKKIKDRTLTASDFIHSKTIEEKDMNYQFRKTLFSGIKGKNSQKKQVLFSEVFKLKFIDIEPNLLEKVIQTAEDVYRKIEGEKNQKTRKQSFTAEFRKTSINKRSKSHCFHTSIDKQRKSTEMSTFQREIDICQESMKDKEIREYFEKCIQTVKKDIATRKNKKSINFFKSTNFISLEEFKNLDFYRLLELFTGHDKVYNILEECLVGKRRDL